MTGLEYVDPMRRYCERRYGGSKRLELERAAVDPSDGWLTLEVPVLVEELDIAPRDVHERPDELIAQARAGFRAFVDEHDLGGPSEYAQLPVHLTGLSRLRDRDIKFRSVRDNLNTATILRSVEASEITAETRISSLTYRCPAGHETTLAQPLFREWRMSRCGADGCTAPVVAVDSRTVLRRVLAFSIDTDGVSVGCVAAGKPAADPGSRRGLSDATRLSVTGIPRAIPRNEGGFDPAMEVLHAEPVG